MKIVFFPVVFALASCASTPPRTTPPFIFSDSRQIIKSLPDLEKENSVGIGENMYEEYRFNEMVRYRVTLLDDAAGVMDFNAKPELPKGGQYFLFKTSVGKLNAVCPDKPIKASIPGSYKFCLVDTKNTGEFDSSMFTERLRYFPLSTPVKYKIEKDELKQTFHPDEKNIKTKAIYQGVNKGSIKISFREFYNDIARPSFTQDISYDLNSSGETLIAFKGLRIKVISADNEKIYYKIASHFD